MDTPGLRDFLEIPYDRLEELNLTARQERLDRRPEDEVREERVRYLVDEKRIKAVTVCFTDLEGCLHMLDYDKKFLLSSPDDLTFDGSAIRGFAAQQESDLRLDLDWPAFYWLPADIFGPGKVLVFAQVRDQDGSPYPADFRGRLKSYCDVLHAEKGITCNVANEIEGFLFEGLNAEQHYHETGHFEFISTGGYYNSLPGSLLRKFIDTAAEAQRAMGFNNEKDHPEVAPSQFEMNYSQAEAVIACDQVQLYKLLCRQVAQNTGLTASFLPKPVTNVNGTGMHANLSLSDAHGANLFYDVDGEAGVSNLAWDFVDRTLNSAQEMCLVLNSSVNAYRRLDPRFEAPNQIIASANNRGAMIRIPLGSAKSARVEFRSIAPDANAYLATYALLRIGLDGPKSEEPEEQKRSRTRFLPDNIYDGIRLFKGSQLMSDVLGETVHKRFWQLKQASAERCPAALGSQIKAAEIQFHHEVTNQYLWGMF
ncbi:MAG: glutamine synthetase [Actinobacteria bacterium]|nr:glutamine synthetase [Actinomycetota bacterium]